VRDPDEGGLTHSAFRVLPIALASFVATPSRANPQPGFWAHHVEGVVLTRGQNSPQWHRVKEGTKLPEGQLIQITDGAAVTIEERGADDDSGLKGDRVQLTLTKPIVTRVTSDLLRQVKLSSIFVNQRSSPRLSTQPASEIPLTLHDAWQRTAALISGIPKEATPIPNMVELENQGMALALSAKKLQILSPVTNSLVEAKEWPSELKVTWLTPPGVPRKYLVYVWKTGTTRGAPQAETRGDNFALQLGEPGTYYIQVASTDGVWLSPAHVVYALTPTEALTGGDATVEQRPIASLMPRYPPDHFVVSSRTPRVAITFAWTSEARGYEASSVLRIRSESGSTVREVQTRIEEADVSLPPGTYVWTVSPAGAATSTEPRHIEILDDRLTNAAQDHLQILRRYVSGVTNTTIILEDGL